MSHSSSHVWERCQRVAGMGWDELRVRAYQEIAKRWDLAAGRIGRHMHNDDHRPASEGSGRFFFRCSDVPLLLDFLRQRLPEEVEDIVAQAERICSHRFDLLGYRAVDWGKDIDWQVDAVHGKRAPNSPWFQIRYLDFDQVGDAKITWELNRHQHLVTLAKAYRLTGTTRYADELFQQWYHWQEQNAYGVGINWCSSLEVAFRSLSWIWVAQLLQGCGVVPQRFPADLAGALAVNARHIERFLSTYFSPNTHLLGEGVGLFFIGTLNPRSPRTQRWQEHGWRIVLQEAQRQVLPDGMHFEQSIYYHAYALDFFLHARTLAQVNGISIPASFDRTIEKMLEVLSALASAGPLPHLGDDDGGRLFNPQRNATEHLADSLAAGSVLFNRRDFKSAVGKLCEETVWLLGMDGARRFESLRGESPEVASFALPSSGTYVMCSSFPAEHRLVIDAGPQGAGRAGHGHADALSVQLAVGGQPLLIDPGTLSYVRPNNERDTFRGTAAHSTVQIDGLNQADPAGPFGWKHLPIVKVNRWLTGETFDFFSGWHSGYAGLPHPVWHYRYIFYLKPHFWLVRDVLTGQGSHRVEAAWHFAPGVLSAIPGGAQFWNGQEHLTLLFSANTGCSREISQDRRSEVYGREEQAPTLRLSGWTHVPSEFATLLIPAGRFAHSPGLLQVFEGTPSGVAVQPYVWSQTSGKTFIFFAKQFGSWQIGPWASDAQFVFASMDAKQNLKQFIVCDGSYLELCGKRIFASRTAVARSEWLARPGGHEFLCSDEPAMTLTPSMLTVQSC
jgi:hypothetical protein